MCRVRTTGPLHKPKLFNVKLHLMRHTDHKNGTPSKLLTVIYELQLRNSSFTTPACISRLTDV